MNKQFEPCSEKGRTQLCEKFTLFILLCCNFAKFRVPYDKFLTLLLFVSIQRSLGKCYL